MGMLVVIGIDFSAGSGSEGIPTFITGTEEAVEITARAMFGTGIQPADGKSLEHDSPDTVLGIDSGELRRRPPLPAVTHFDLLDVVGPLQAQGAGRLHRCGQAACAVPREGRYTLRRRHCIQIRPRNAIEFPTGNFGLRIQTCTQQYSESSDRLHFAFPPCFISLRTASTTDTSRQTCRSPLSTKSRDNTPPPVGVSSYRHRSYGHRRPAWAASA